MIIPDWLSRWSTGALEIRFPNAQPRRIIASIERSRCMTTVVRVRKWGNGLAIRLPRQFALERGLVVGSAVDIGQIRIANSGTRRRGRYKLNEMLRNYTKLPANLDFAPTGRELN
jgi:antitoxin component of MazEF toxin-antitoxin module